MRAHGASAEGVTKRWCPRTVNGSLCGGDLGHAEPCFPARREDWRRRFDREPALLRALLRSGDKRGGFARAQAAVGRHLKAKTGAWIVTVVESALVSVQRQPSGPQPVATPTNTLAHAESDADEEALAPPDDRLDEADFQKLVLEDPEIRTALVLLLLSAMLKRSGSPWATTLHQMALAKLKARGGPAVERALAALAPSRALPALPPPAHLGALQDGHASRGAGT